MEQHSTIQDNQQDDEDKTLSKNQLKKLAKRKRWLESRPERRKLEREKKKAKRKSLAQERIATGQVMEDFTKRSTLMANSSNKFKVVIDMDFEEYMTDQEIAKAVQQVGRIYAINRHSKSPCQLFVTSLKGKIRDRFAITNTGYQSWDINYSEFDYVTLLSKCDQAENESCDSSVINKSQFVYLSGDSDNTLPDVDSILRDESKTYVIGGLVDHNRHKNLCHKRALERQIPTAKLPIKENVNLSQRHILSTVTVFEILLSVLGARKSWAEALVSSIPKRKIAPTVASSESMEMEGADIPDDHSTV